MLSEDTRPKGVSPLPANTLDFGSLDKMWPKLPKADRNLELLGRPNEATETTKKVNGERMIEARA